MMEGAKTVAQRVWSEDDGWMNPADNEWIGRAWMPTEKVTD